MLRTSAASSYNFSSKLCSLNLVFLSVDEMEADLRMALSAGSLSRSAYGLRDCEEEKSSLRATGSTALKSRSR